MEEWEIWVKTMISRSLQYTLSPSREKAFLAKWLALPKPQNDSFLADEEKRALRTMSYMYMIEAFHAESIERMRALRMRFGDPG